MTLARRLELADILGHFRGRIVAEGADVERELQNLQASLAWWRAGGAVKTREMVDYEAVRAMLEARV